MDINMKINMEIRIFLMNIIHVQILRKFSQYCQKSYSRIPKPARLEQPQTSK